MKGWRHAKGVVKGKGTRTCEIRDIPSLCLLQKNEKASSEENMQGLSEQPVDREVSVGGSHSFKHTPQQEPGVEMGLHPETLPAPTRGDTLEHGITPRDPASSN